MHRRFSFFVDFPWVGFLLLLSLAQAKAKSSTGDADFTASPIFTLATVGYAQENDDATGNTPLEVERLLRPSAGVVSGEYMNRQESLSSEKVEEDDEEDADGEREGGDACVAAAETGNPTGGCGGKPGRKRGKDGGLCGAGNGAAIETIQNLLLMIPVDLEKLRNQAWEKGGYQVKRGDPTHTPNLLLLLFLLLLLLLLYSVPVFELSVLIWFLFTQQLIALIPPRAPCFRRMNFD